MFFTLNLERHEYFNMKFLIRRHFMIIMFHRPIYLIVLARMYYQTRIIYLSMVFIYISPKINSIVLIMQRRVVLIVFIFKYYNYKYQSRISHTCSWCEFMNNQKELCFYHEFRKIRVFSIFSHNFVSTIRFIVFSEQ